MRELSTEECIHIYEYGQLKSKSFVPEAVNAAYVAGLAALYEKLEREKNDPLTLDELLEMDGEPVWITKNEQKGCAIVYAPCSIVYLTLGTGTHWDAEDLIAEGCKIYRCKPEGRTL